MSRRRRVSAAAATGAPPVLVVAGALVAADGRVLIAERPAGRSFAGRWEFPGGKVRAGETARAALDRELAEELGISVERAEPLLALTHRYPGAAAAVCIDCWRVRAWRGVPAGLDGQQLRWCLPAALADADLLEADRPIVTALRLPAHFAPATGAPRGRALPRGPVAWLAADDAPAVAADGDLVCVVDPATPAGHCSVYTRADRFVPAADRHALVGLVVAGAAQAAAAARLGADFLLVPDESLAVAELAGIAAAGLPWYVNAAAAARAAATGTLQWPGAAHPGDR